MKLTEKTRVFGRNSLPQSWRTGLQVADMKLSPVIRADRRWRKLSKQGLFIIGHMRTGTTVLQNALNESTDIFLFGEANFHRDPGSSDFRDRYNQWHESQGNQPTKSTRCLALFKDDASWSDYLLHFSRYHRFVGEKIVINPGENTTHCDALMDFMATHFYESQFVFCFRNPVDVMNSAKKMTEFQGTQMSDLSAALTSYLSVMRLYLTMVRLFRNVHVVFHEDPSSACFNALGNNLGVDLHHVTGYYQTERVSRHAVDELPESCRKRVLELDDLYNHFRERVHGGFALPQLEQNRFCILPTHPTPLGGLYNATELLLRDLTAA
ncbi:MAG TPA: sulfotransferase [Burkholderiaceae bacterium]|nr:sulfotransferase [Burkholderiaceae bacterium]